MKLQTLFFKYQQATLLGIFQPWKILYQHRQLFKMLLKRDITNRTAGTVLGDIWLVLQPALQIIGFWFLLDIVLRVKLPNQVEFVNYFLIGMLLWLFIAEVLTRSLGILREFSGLYQRSIFPLALLPWLSVGLSIILYAIVLFIVTFLLHGGIAASLAMVILISVAIWLIPLCYLLAIIGLFLKDLAQFFPFLITLTMYLTPVMYLPQQLPINLQWLLILNPVADWLVLLHAVTQGTSWELMNIIRPFLYWLLWLAPSWIIFTRAEPQIRELL